MNRMSTIIGMFTSFLVLAGVWTLSPVGADSQTPPSTGEEYVAVQKTIPFAEGSNVSEAIRKECRLQTRTPSFIQRFASEHGVYVGFVDSFDTSNDSRRQLHLKIENVRSEEGGWLGGEMSMQVNGRLMDDGETIATVAVRRQTSGGLFSIFKGTCDIIGRCSQVIGQDLARWLDDPQDGAKIGDF